jgi:hypothetical protein
MKYLVKKLVQVMLVVVALLGVTGISHAVTIIPVSYDMPNGSGIARGGYSNYWDASSTGSGALTTDGAALTGLTGKLTDGAIATESWASTDTQGHFAVSPNLGLYVGWTWGDPTITFHFGRDVNVDNITFYVDNPANDIKGNPQGGVAAPKSFTIGDKSYFSGYDTSINNNNKPGTGPVAINIDNLGLNNIKDLSVTIDRDTYGGTRFWLFCSEITFDDGVPAPVPEPSTFLLFGAGIAGFALLRNRRKA